MGPKLTKAQKIHNEVDSATLIWEPKSEPLLVGDELDGSYLNAYYPNIDGSFEYNPSYGHKFLSPGTYDITVKFIPMKSKNRTSVKDEYTATKSITVSELGLSWKVPEAITYGTALTEGELRARCNAGIDGTFTYDPSLGYKLPPGQHTLTATFSREASATDSSGRSQDDFRISTTILVKKIYPLLAWENIPELSVGEQLERKHLCAKCTNKLDGKFKYEPDIGAVFDIPGAHTLSTVFVPSAAVEDHVFEARLNVEIIVKDKGLEWSSPGSIEYGVPLSERHLNARSKRRGSIKYDPPVGTVLPVGAHTLKATFLPEFAVEGESVDLEATVKIEVKKATPTILWRLRDKFFVGDQLNKRDHLTAVCSAGVKGTFHYDPDEGYEFTTAGPHTLTVVFKPDREASFKYLKGQKEIVINVISTDIVWAEPDPIQYGEPLSEIHLNAEPPPEKDGNMEYSPELGTILRPGRHTLTVAFYPSRFKGFKDSALTLSTVKPILQTVSILVEKIEPRIVWEPLHSLCAGEALTEFHLNARCLGSDTDGSFEYDPPLGHVFEDIGENELSANFVGGSDGVYRDCSHKICITVGKPVQLVWEEPAAIAFGEPLSGLQLCAVCGDSAGVFHYRPPLGTVLPPGLHTLTVEFFRDLRMCQGPASLVPAQVQGQAQAQVPESTQSAAGQSDSRSPIDAPMGAPTTIKTVTIIVEKLRPEIVWEPLHSLCAGEALTEFHLNARCSASDATGSFAYEPPAGHVFEESGEREINVIFTAAADGVYLNSEMTITIKVCEPVAIHWAEPAPIVFGQPLTEQQLNAQCIDHQGVFGYEPGLGAVLPAGQQTLRVRMFRDCCVGCPEKAISHWPQCPVREIALTVEKAMPRLLWDNPPAPLVIGQKLSSHQLNARCAPNIKGSFFYDPGFGSGFHTAGSFPIVATFVPAGADATNYNSGRCTVEVAVRAVELMWEQPEALVYGECLSEKQLNAQCSLQDLDGIFVYEPPFGTLLDSGWHKLHVKFYMCETIVNESVKAVTIDLMTLYKCEVASASVTVVVKKASPHIVWQPSKTALHVGEALSEAQLNASASASAAGELVEGKFFYHPPMGATFATAGVQELSVTFVPSQAFTSNFDPVKVTTTVSIYKVYLTWAEPSPITYGEPLSDKQLNAQSSGRDGRFEYTPNLGVLLSGGEHTLKVRFFPSGVEISEGDTYSGFEATVRLMVERVLPEIVWDPPTRFFVGDSFTRDLQNAYCMTEIGGDFFYDPGPGYRFDAAGEEKLTVYFRPRSGLQGNYCDAKKVVVVSVISTEIAWEDPESMIYGALLSERQLNATADRPGRLVYEPDLSTLLNAGTHILTVTLLPDHVNRNEGGPTAVGLGVESSKRLTKSVTLEVKRAVPMLVWDNCKAALVGQRLSNLHLNASVEGGIDGRFFYDPPLGTVFERPGDRELSVTFVPSEIFSSNYEPTRKKVLVNVHDASITWSEPDPIVYGEALSEKQLNAQCYQSVGRVGSFEYTPSLGTVLPAGVHMLSARFVPAGVAVGASEAAAFTRATMLRVHKQVPTISWEITTPVYVHQRLSEKQLNAVCSQGIEGQFVYKPSFGESLSAIGRHELSVRFVPAEGCQDNYTESTQSVWVDVIGIRLQWDAPSEIEYGAPLSLVNTLTAFCEDQEGIYLYDPEVGTILSAGDHVLTCKFYAFSTLAVELVKEIVESSDEDRPRLLQSLKAVINAGKVTTTPVTASVALTVRKVAPSLAWATPPPLYEDEPLTAAHLSCHCESELEGKFFYEPGQGHRFKEPGVYNLSAIFVPSDANFSAAKMEIQIEVENLQLTWEDPEPIVFGEPLSVLQLNSFCSEREGIFVYRPPIGTVLEAGLHRLHVDFYPHARGTDEESAFSMAVTQKQAATGAGGGSVLEFAHRVESQPMTKSVLLQVSKYQTRLMWRQPRIMLKGEKLCAAQLNAKCVNGIEGRYYYQPSWGSSFKEPGMKEIMVNFVPAEKFQANYETAEMNVYVEVHEIVWEEPSAIVFGEPLTEKQLNARSTASGGSLVYEPSLGTVLGAGVHTLSVLYFAETESESRLDRRLSDDGPDSSVSVAASASVLFSASASTSTSTSTLLHTHKVSVNLRVMQFVPTLSWELGNFLLVSEELTEAHLTATCNVDIPGVFEYEPRFGDSFGEPGLQIMRVTFTPAEDYQMNYSCTSTTVEVDVCEAIIEWNDPEQIIFGDALTEVQLNASCNACEGIFNYDPPFGTVLDAGFHPLVVTFSPLNRRVTLTKTVSLWVTKAVPEIVWALRGDEDFQVGWELSPAYASIVAPREVEGVLTYDPPMGHIFAQPGPQTLSVRFTPAESFQQNYTTASVSKDIHVAEADCVIWETPAAIVYGETLTEAQLNASCLTRKGIFQYSPPLGTLLGAGDHVLQAIFLPDSKSTTNPRKFHFDEDGFPVLKSSQKCHITCVTAQVVLVVQKAVPRLEWGVVPNLLVGQPLTAEHLIVVCLGKVDGQFRFEPDIGFRFHEKGRKTLSAVFTPIGSSHADYAEANISTTVDVVDIEVKWPHPAPIVYGELLGEKQLNAQCSTCEGSFQYSPPVGTLLGAGSHTLQVMLHPKPKVKRLRRDPSVSQHHGGDKRRNRESALSESKNLNRLFDSREMASFEDSKTTYGGWCDVGSLKQDEDKQGFSTLRQWPTLGEADEKWGLSSSPRRMTFSAAEDKSPSPSRRRFTFSQAAEQKSTRVSGSWFESKFDDDEKENKLDFNQEKEDGKEAEETSEGELEEVTPVIAMVTIHVHRATPTLSWSNCSTVLKGEPLTEAHLNASCNERIEGTFSYSPSFGFRFQDAGTKVLSVEFVPSLSTRSNYTEARLSVPLRVDNVAITWPHPEPIMYGEALSQKQLNATCLTCDGVFVYSPEIGTVLRGGAHTLHVVFHPTPTSHRLSQTGLTIQRKSENNSHVDDERLRITPVEVTVPIRVHKSTPRLAWADVPFLYVSEPLTQAHLSALCLDPVQGQFSYQPSLGHRFTEEGLKTLSVDFTPSHYDLDSWSDSKLIVSVEVKPINVVWRQPGPIFFGEPLSERQLNAYSLSCDGAFEYSPPLGTVLGAGDHTLRVVFRPTAKRPRHFHSISGGGGRKECVERDMAENEGLSHSVYSADGAERTVTPVQCSVVIRVNKLMPKLWWAEGPKLYAKEPITQRHLNASCSDAIEGICSYEPGEGHCFMEEGVKTLLVTFTPSPAYQRDYCEASMVVRMTVERMEVEWESPEPIVFGEALGDKQLRARCGSRPLGVFVYSPPAGTVLDAGEHTLRAIFHPPDTDGEHTFGDDAAGVPHEVSMKLTVHKAIPRLEWEDIPNLRRATPLTSDHLKAVCLDEIEGELIYNPALDHRFQESGTQKLSVKFVPSVGFARNYTEAGLERSVEVMRIDLHWDAPSAITYGEPLTEKQLSAYCGDVEGVYVYAPKLGTVLSAGSHELQVFFYPKVVDTLPEADGGLDYAKGANGLQQQEESPEAALVTAAGAGGAGGAANGVTAAGSGASAAAVMASGAAAAAPLRATTTLIVRKATPVIKWDFIQGLSVGESLTPVHLNATCFSSSGSVSGTFVYRPSVGHRYSEPGLQELSVTFTPSIGYEANYTPAECSIQIAVQPMQLVWEVPAAIDYGDPLNEQQLNAHCPSHSGIFRYEPRLGVTLPAGLHKLAVTFYPFESNDAGLKKRSDTEQAHVHPDDVVDEFQREHKAYNPRLQLMDVVPVTQKLFITVNKAPAALTWELAAPVVVGEPLTVDICNAKCTAGIDGNFFYDPPLGHRFLEPGPTRLSVTFVPARVFQRNFSEGKHSIAIEVLTTAEAQRSRPTPPPLTLQPAAGGLHKPSVASASTARSATPKRAFRFNK